MQSCDKMYKYHYKVENNTNSSLVIHYIAENYSKIDTIITIHKDSSSIIFIADSHGAEGGNGPFDNFFDIKGFEILSIDTIKTKIDLSNKKYWQFSKIGDIGFYDLIVDSVITKQRK